MKMSCFEIVLGVAFILIIMCLWRPSTATEKFETKTNPLRSHILKSIQSEDGDIIDCIDVYKQPAFAHPALRNHTIQMAPSSFMRRQREKNEDEEFCSDNCKNHNNMEVRQVWQRRGMRCPKGTIPVRRMKKRAIKKPVVHHYFHTDNNLSVQLPNHSKAVLLTVGYRYLGGKGDIKVFNPNVEKDDEYSLSQITLANGPHDNYESLQSGWAVNPGVYGDRQTRFFVYWTSDGSRRTGCFDLTCPGFVQTSNEIALGAAIHPISVPNGLPYQITVYIFKDPTTNNWWVEYGEKIRVGYWPAEILGVLRSNADSVEWGGEVFSRSVGATPHTATAMGSGNFPDIMFGSSGTIRRMRIHDNSAALKFPEWVETYTDEYKCYDIIYVGDYIVDPVFYYGGPGKNLMCP